MTKEPLTLSQFASLGGHARAKKLTATQKSAIGANAARARWKKRGNKQSITKDFLLERADCSGGPDACWPWMRRRSSAGYGALTVNYRRAYAHRLMLELELGVKLGSRQYVIHSCDNPPCINPKHLSVGTAKQNAMDCSKKKRHFSSRKTHCPHGHKYDEENTRYNKRAGGRVFRSCGICNAQRAKKSRDKTRVLKYVAKPKMAQIYAERRARTTAELKDYRRRLGIG